MIGYEFLLSKIGMPMFPLQQPARIKPVTRVESRPDMLAVPRHVAPADDNILSHVLFALRYETIQMPILDRALRLVTADELLAGLANKPQAGYQRRAAYLWENANGQLRAKKLLRQRRRHVFCLRRHRWADPIERSRDPHVTTFSVVHTGPVKSRRLGPNGEDGSTLRTNIGKKLQ